MQVGKLFVETTLLQYMLEIQKRDTKHHVSTISSLVFCSQVSQDRDQGFLISLPSHILSAYRAGPLQSEPFIYAMQVEEMSTARQQSCGFTTLQILE